MAPFDECSVLLPSATLEDFPVGGSPSDARSLLAGWTVLWHPLLLAQTEQLPTWYRADAPPTPDGPRVIVVPDPSKDQIPTDFRRKCDANPACVWVTGPDRQAMLAALDLDPNDPTAAPLEFSGRTLGVEDFFAAGYLSLQIQIMTRRLRYTSNLDELHLQNRMTEAAKAFRNRDATATAEGLHDVFDCLSEERDHYFSTDPHLVDLTLLTPGVLDSAIESGWVDRIRSSATVDDESNGVLGASKNVLVDGEIAAKLVHAANDPIQAEKVQPFREMLDDPAIGWAGGGSIVSDGGAECFDAMTMAAAREAFQTGTSVAREAVGEAPKVYARLSGMTPADLIPALSSLGYQGVIPIDFAAGTGFGEESKVIVSGGGSELEALTAKPIDAASDTAFLSIGALLGESIDSGEIATALLVHWPDRICDSFSDLSRAATWSVALGRFWTIDRYFTDGERPYHNGNLDSLAKASAGVLAEELSGDSSEATLQSMATAFGDTVRNETQQLINAVACLAAPKLLDEFKSSEQCSDAAINQALGVKQTEGDAQADLVCFNPHGVAARCQSVLDGGAPSKEKFVYAATGLADGSGEVTYDVPAIGFTRLSAVRAAKKVSLLKRVTKRNRGIAEPTILRNEFMAVSLDEETGGLSGVFSASRGNRLSARLVAGESLAGGQDGGRMLCDRIEVKRSDLAFGEIESSGKLVDASGKQLAKYSLLYQLERGSRQLRLKGSLDLGDSIQGISADQLWNNYFAIRTAVAGEAAIFRPLVRDKVHSSSGRKMVAPLGVLIDESEKQTLVISHGLPLHRKVGDRFLDTLVALPNQKHGVAGPVDFQISYALDSPQPVAVARAGLAPMRPVRVERAADGSDSTSQAWLVHVSASDVIVTQMKTVRRTDGKLATRMQLIQTRPKSSKVQLQFCAFAHAAFVADESGVERPLEELPQDVVCDDGIVELTVGHHQVVDLVVVFDI